MQIKKPVVYLQRLKGTGCSTDYAGMVKLVDTPDLGSGAARCEGSSPFTRTSKPLQIEEVFLWNKAKYFY